VSAGSLASSVEPEIISLFNFAAVTEFEASLAVVTFASTILAVVTVASVGTPADKELPNTIMKSITSPVDRLDANVSVEPLTVKELPGDCIVPLSETKNWLTVE